MIKRIGIFSIILLVVLLTACTEQKQSISYHPSYIDVNGGYRWLNYGVIPANAYTGERDGTLSVLYCDKDPLTYELLFTINSNYYKEEDIILGTRKYLYIFSQNNNQINKIISYKLDGSDKYPDMWENEIIKSIKLIYGANDEYIFAKIYDMGIEKDIKINKDLNTIQNVDDSYNISNEIKYEIFAR